MHVKEHFYNTIQLYCLCVEKFAFFIHVELLYPPVNKRRPNGCWHENTQIMLISSRIIKMMIVASPH